MTFRGIICVSISVLGLLFFASLSDAANLPCSGRKGGIARCQGDTFICNDGSVSGSKRSCSAYMGTGSLGLMGGARSSSQMAPSAGAGCSCRDGNYCVGPRGGRYCLSDSGKKSYLRN